MQQGMGFDECVIASDMESIIQCEWKIWDDAASDADDVEQEFVFCGVLEFCMVDDVVTSDEVYGVSCDEMRDESRHEPSYLRCCYFSLRCIDYMFNMSMIFWLMKTM